MQPRGFLLLHMLLELIRVSTCEPWTREAFSGNETLSMPSLLVLSCSTPSPSPSGITVGGGCRWDLLFQVNGMEFARLSTFASVSAPLIFFIEPQWHNQLYESKTRFFLFLFLYFWTFVSTCNDNFGCVYRYIVELDSMCSSDYLLNIIEEMHKCCIYP